MCHGEISPTGPKNTPLTRAFLILIAPCLDHSFFLGHSRPVLHSCGWDSTAKTIKTSNVEYIFWSRNIASSENLQFWMRHQTFFFAVVLFFFYCMFSTLPRLCNTFPYVGLQLSQVFISHIARTAHHHTPVLMKCRCEYVWPSPRAPYKSTRLCCSSPDQIS